MNPSRVLGALVLGGVVRSTSKRVYEKMAGHGVLRTKLQKPQMKNNMTINITGI
jgi:hypothetical protein